MKDFLLKCFERDPAKRPSAAALLEHPWVKGRARKGSRIKDQEPEKPKKRKAKRKGAETCFSRFGGR
jgi:serine/threonine protein kinase